MSAPVDADAVWAVLEPLGWKRFDGAWKTRFTSPPDGVNGMIFPALSITWIDWNPNQEEFLSFDRPMTPRNYHIMAPALAALSRLLGDTGHAAPDEVTHE